MESKTTDIPGIAFDVLVVEIMHMDGSGRLLFYMQPSMTVNAALQSSGSFGEVVFPPAGTRGRNIVLFVHCCRWTARFAGLFAALINQRQRRRI